MTTSTSDPALPIYRQAIYNPGRLTDAEVKASYIARQGLLEELLADVRASRPGGRPQHHLVVGQRGMGKTTLLRRLAVSLREDPSLAGFVPLSFPEEQWTIDRLSKLWLNSLDSLADSLERQGQAGEAIEGIDAAVDSLRRDHQDEGLLAEAAEREFLQQAALVGRRPVLFIDNLDLVFSRLASHEKNRLRAFLTAAGSPILIGACVSPPDETIDYSAPFYDHFKMYYLERLSLEEMQEVLRRLAEQAGRKEILGRLDQEWPRLKTLYTLTGANPRTIVILFQVLSTGFSKEAYQDLETLLDWITPFYKARFEELAPQAQLIVSELATHWEPASARQLCEKTRLENRQISPQLDRLRKAGVVEVVPIDPEVRKGPLTGKAAVAGRKGYQLAERFFNIWFLMRQATRRDRQNLIFLTRFIECTHTPAERAALARDLLSKHPLSREEYIYGLALEPTVSDHSLRYELHDHVQQEIVDASRQLKQKIDELIDPSEIPAHRYTFADVRARLKEKAPADVGIIREDFVDTILGSSALLDRRDAIASQDLDVSKAQELLAIAEADRRLDEEFAGLDAAEWYRNLLRLGTLVDLSSGAQFGEAIRRADTWEKVSICVKHASGKVMEGLSGAIWEKIWNLAFSDKNYSELEGWKQWGDLVQSKFQRFDDAEFAYRKTLDLDSHFLSARLALGDLLWRRLGRGEEAEDLLRAAIAEFPEEYDSWYQWARYLHSQEDRFKEAEEAYLKALELDSGRWLALANLGALYHYRLRRFSEAEELYLCAIKLLESGANAEAWGVWRELGNLYHYRMEEFSKAEEAYRQAIDLQGDEPSIEISWTWNSFGLLLADRLGRGEEAEAAFRRAKEVDSEHSLAPRYNLVSVLRDQLNRIAEAKQIVEELPSPEARTLRAGIALHPALFAAYEDDWDRSRSHLVSALDLIADRDGIPEDTLPGWMRATAVLVHLGYGERLLEFLRERGDDRRLRPWYEAIRAHVRGDRRYLRNIPAEMREVAGMLYDQVQVRLEVLPDSTRRSAPGARSE